MSGPALCQRLACSGWHTGQLDTSSALLKCWCQCFHGTGAPGHETSTCTSHCSMAHTENLHPPLLTISLPPAFSQQREATFTKIQPKTLAGE